MRNVLRTLTERLPRGRLRLPGRARSGGRLDVEAAAIGLSLAFHAVLLGGLALAGFQGGRAVMQRSFESEVLDNLLAPSDATFQDLDQTLEPPAAEAVAGSFAPTLAPTITSAPSTAGGVPVSSRSDAEGGLAPELARLDVRRATEMVLPTATMLGQNVSIQGNGAETVGDVKGAVDRIAVEIVRHLERGPSLVVWAFDASGSLQAERRRLGKHIEAVYAHIHQLDESQLARDDGLLTMVVSFGQGRRALLDGPTADRAEIFAAIGKVVQDDSGIETTFATVADVLKKWGAYRDGPGRQYHTMVIVVTDEVGDDESRLEEAIKLAERARAPVYVLGSQAIFGRAINHVDYTDPKTKKTYRGLEVRQGPESAMIEQIKLPFWYGGPQYDVLESGFGPYALSRLASATGGIYFITRFDARRMGFNPARMSEYRPDWISRAAYEKMIARSPLRQAVINASLLTQQKLPPMPALTFPAVEDPRFKDVMATNQGVAERTVYTVDEALGPINAAAKYRDREVSRRWQAHFDLVRGRLLAMKVRCYEYNWACALLKKDPPKFQKPNSNAWRLEPDTAIRYSAKAEKAAREAEKLLRRVVEDHAETPWALLAERELRNPLGFKWVETHVAPPRRGNPAAAKAKKKNAPPSRPAPPPPKL